MQSDKNVNDIIHILKTKYGWTDLNEGDEKSGFIEHLLHDVLKAIHQVPQNYLTELNKIEQLDENPDSLVHQMEVLRVFGHRLGFFKACDELKNYPKVPHNLRKCWNCKSFRIKQLEDNKHDAQYHCLTHEEQCEISDPKWQVCPDFDLHSNLKK